MIDINGIKNLEIWNQEFSKELEKYEFVKNIRQKGTIIAFEIETGVGNTYFSDIKTQAYNFFLKKGILIRPLGNVIFLNPPLIISKIEYDKIITSILQFLSEDIK